MKEGKKDGTAARYVCIPTLSGRTTKTPGPVPPHGGPHSHHFPSVRRNLDPITFISSSARVSTESASRSGHTGHARDRTQQTPTFPLHHPLLPLPLPLITSPPSLSTPLSPHSRSRTQNPLERGPRSGPQRPLSRRVFTRANNVIANVQTFLVINPENVAGHFNTTISPSSELPSPGCCGDP